MITPEQTRVAQQSMESALTGILSLTFLAADDPDAVRARLTALVAEVPVLPLEGPEKTATLLMLSKQIRTDMRALYLVLKAVSDTPPEPVADDVGMDSGLLP